MTDPRAELEALAGRLQEAAMRLKEEHAEPERDAGGGLQAGADTGEHDTEALGLTLARLEEAGAAVRDARRRLFELESRLRAS
jgi:hypothetical protein